ncbi:hypothetical protein AB6O49_19130 [Streptomyces sp. SBR177]
MHRHPGPAHGRAQPLRPGPERPHAAARPAAQEGRTGPLQRQDPLHEARNADSAHTDAWVDKVKKQGYAWSSTVSGLEFYPNAPRDPDKIFEQTGLLPWLYEAYWNSIDVVNPWWDPAPTADDPTKAAALAIGDGLYTSGGSPQEQEAWKLWKKNSGKVEPNQYFIPRLFADDARIFLSSGGFPARRRRRTRRSSGSPSRT